ncbi:MAG: hypothetical protein PHC51_08215 [bacterium]|nr:hypothetical protein [bacterium]
MGTEQINQNSESISCERDRIFVLGAGFSAAAGVPITENLLDQALELMLREQPYLGSKINSYLSQVCRTAGNSKSSFQKLSDLCTFIEYNDLREFAGGERWSDNGSREKLTLRYYLSKVIVNSTPYGEQIPKLYLKFAEQLRPGDLVVTFNWDCLLENSLEYIGTRYSYKMESGVVWVAKMHGSVNWRLRRYRSPNSFKWNDLEYNEFEDIPPVYYSEEVRNNRRVWTPEALLGEIDPYIVLPGFGKAFDVRPLSWLWYKPEGWLWGKKQVVVIGLSMSNDDFFIRSVFLDILPSFLGEEGRSVVVIDPSKETLKNYEFIANEKGVQLLSEPFSEKHISLFENGW